MILTKKGPIGQIIKLFVYPTRYTNSMAECNKNLRRSKRLELNNTFSKKGENLIVVEISNRKI